MRTNLLLLVVLGCCSPLAFAQGSQAFTLQTNTGTTFDNVMTSMDITATRPLSLYRLSAAGSMQGTAVVEIWLRPGGIGVDPGFPNQLPLTNWQFAGSAEVAFDAPGELAEVPVNLDRLMAANETIGVVMVTASGFSAPRLRHYMHGAGLQPPVTNGDLTVNSNSWMGAYLASGSPRFNSYYSLASQTYATISYDAGPTVAPSTQALALPNAAFGSAGTAVSYEVSGAMLTGDTTITAPAGVEISFSETSGYASILRIYSYPDYQPTKVYARFASSAPTGPVSGEITHSSAGAPTRGVALSGNVIAMSTDATSLNVGQAVVGSAGNPGSFTVTASGLVANTTVTATQGFEVAKSVSGPFGPTATINAMNYVQPIFVRLSGDSIGMKSGSVNIASGAASLAVTVGGEVIPPFELKVIRNGPGATSYVDNNAAGDMLLLDVTLRSFSEAWTVTSLEFQASGTANADTALSSLRLFQDSTSGVAGQFDAADMPAAAASSFIGGTAQFVLNDSAFPTLTTRRFFLVGTLAGTATVSQTLRVELAGTVAHSPGPGSVNGVPTTGAAPALTINPSIAEVTLNGPGAYTTVANDSQGPNGYGHVVADITIRPQNDSWSVPSITFGETGSIDARDGLSYLGLHIDNGNGVWDGPGVDVLATATAADGFSAPNGLYKAWLTPAATQFGVNESKRFFLVAKLAGTATPGQVMRVAATTLEEYSPNQGEMFGTPTPATSALVVQLATLSVSAGPANPSDVALRAGTAGQAVVAQIRLTASVTSFDVEGLVLTTGGSGDWAASLDAATGVQVYACNGDGMFSSSDSLIFSGPGSNGTVNATFGSSVKVNAFAHVDLWVVLNTNDSAGSSAETFSASIADVGDVLVVQEGAYVAFGTMPPQIASLRVVDLQVTEFLPATGSGKGGAAITVRGSGFALPVVLTIGGVQCAGNAMVNSSGTEITGLIVPEGSGKNLAIVLETNSLEPIVLAQTFTYSKVSTGDSTQAAGCTGAPVAPFAAMLPALLGLVALRRRRK